jgi:hypothetical protein
MEVYLVDCLISLVRLADPVVCRFCVGHTDYGHPAEEELVSTIQLEENGKSWVLLQR